MRRLPGGRHVLAIRLVAGHVALIPIAVQQGAVGEPHQMTVRMSRRQLVATLHPVRVFLLQLGQILQVGLFAILFGDECHHLRKERRLRAAQIVGAIAVRNVTVAIDQGRKVLQLVHDQIVPAALLETEHDEVRVPIIDFVEAAARHDVGIRQRQ